MTRFRKIVIAIVGSILVCCSGLVVIALVTPDPEENEIEPTIQNRSQELDIVVEETTESTATIQPTELPPTDIPTAEPIDTIQPTDTPKLTSTPRPSNTATPLPPTATNTQPPLPAATNTQPPPLPTNTQPPPTPLPTATPVIVNTEPPPSPPNPSGCVSINNAGIEDLKRIIHIDDERALDLIANRPYTSLDQLTRIKGIGPARLADIKAEGIACLP